MSRHYYVRFLEQLSARCNLGGEARKKKYEPPTLGAPEKSKPCAPASVEMRPHPRRHWLRAVWRVRLDKGGDPDLWPAE
jgi:hypothetical protein